MSDFYGLCLEGCGVIFLGKKRVVPVFYKCCSRCGKKLSPVSRYWGDPVV